jgi:hypothetical protein
MQDYPVCYTILQYSEGSGIHAFHARKLIHYAVHCNNFFRAGFIFDYV